MLCATRLVGGAATLPGVWKQRVGTEDVTYLFSPDANGRGDLRIQNTTGTTTVKNFRNGELGIALGALVPDDYTLPTTTNTVRMDRIFEVLNTTIFR